MYGLRQFSTLPETLRHSGPMHLHWSCQTSFRKGYFEGSMMPFSGAFRPCLIKSLIWGPSTAIEALAAVVCFGKPHSLFRILCSKSQAPLIQKERNHTSCDNTVRAQNPQTSLSRSSSTEALETTSRHILRKSFPLDLWCVLG